jgi:hypothetical protein
MEELNLGDVEFQEYSRDRRNDIACQAGYVDACNGLLWPLRDCLEGHLEDDAACKHVITTWRSQPHNEARLGAYERLVAMCEAGDAKACDVFPDRAIPDDVLCIAHDYIACARLACFGDGVAGELAGRNGVSHPVGCGHAHQRAFRAWRQSGQDEPPPVVVSLRGPPRRAQMQFSEPLVFREHGGRDNRGWPRYDVYNLSDQAVVEVVVCAESFDESLNEIARVEKSIEAVPIPANGSVVLELSAGSASDRVPRLGRRSWRERITYRRIGLANGDVIEGPTARCQP